METAERICKRFHSYLNSGEYSGRVSSVTGEKLEIETTFGTVSVLNAGALQSESDREVLEELMKVCGVGIKVASCVALFALHRTDAFPIDVWVRRILDEQYPAGYPMEEYRPYNGVYQQYMFAYCRNRR